MEKYKSFEKILTNLNILRFIITSKVRVGDFSANKQVEGFYKDVLNLVYGWNLDQPTSLTNPGIDLIDTASNIGVQVTSQKGWKKVQKTLTLFDTHYYGTQSGKLNRVIVFNITSKSNHSKPFTSNVPFNKKKDIIDVDDLLVEIEKLPTLKIKEIEEYILREIPYYLGKITSEKDFLRNRVDFKNVLPKNFLKFKTFSSSKKDFDEFKNKTLEFHTTLLTVSQKQRLGLLVLLTLCDPIELTLAATTWSDVLMNSFGFQKNEIPLLVKVLDSKGILYYDEDEEDPRIHGTDQNYLATILEIVSDKDKLHDLIYNVNFSILDE